MSFQFIQNPTGQGLTDQDLVTSALDQPMSLGSTFFDQAAGGILESFGLGTVIRESQLPATAPTKPELVITPPEGQGPVRVPDTPQMRRRMTAFESVNGQSLQARPESQPELQTRKDEAGALSEDAYKASPAFRKDIPWQNGMTTARAQALADMDDRKKVREFYGSKRPITSFFGNITGQAVDPLNYIPVMGEAVTAANVARFGRVAGRALTSSIDAAANTAIAGIATAPVRAQFGDDVSFQSTISQIAMAAVIGGAFGAVAGRFGRATTPELRVEAETKLGTLQNVQEARVALNDALDGMIHEGRVEVSPTSADVVARVADTELPKVAINRMAIEADPASFDRLSALDKTFEINDAEIRRLQSETMDNERFGPQRAAMIEADRLAERVRSADAAVGKANSEKQRATETTRLEKAKDDLRKHLSTIDDKTVQKLEEIDAALVARRQANAQATQERSRLQERTKQIRAEAQNRYWQGRQNAPKQRVPEPTKVGETMAQRLVSAGVSEQEAKAQAALYDSFYRVISAKAGKTVEEFLQMYPLPKIMSGGASSAARVGRQYAQFAGVKAKTADSTALDRALVALADGADKDAVKKETGWFVGPDGAMKFEISDKNAALKQGSDKRIADAETHTEYLKTRTIFSTSSKVSLGDLITHDELFRAYPGLKDVAVTTFEKDASGNSIVAMTADGSGGTFVSINKKWWDLPSVTDGARRSALLHEIQHLVQMREGWANGASSSRDVTAYKNNFGEVEARATQARRNMTQEELASSPVVYDVETAKMSFPDMQAWSAKYDAAMIDEARARVSEQENADANATSAVSADALASNALKDINGFSDAAYADGRYNIAEEPDFFAPILADEYLKDPAKFKSFYGSALHDFMGKLTGAEYAQGNKGVIQFPDQLLSGQAVIRLFETADASTIVHESGHFFLGIMQDLSRAGDKSVGENMTALNAWWKLNSSSVLADAKKAYPDARVEQADIDKYLESGSTGNALADKAIDTGLHEQFAKGFEAYLMEGKAPSAGMSSVFDAFRKWLSEVYRNIKSLGVNLDDGVRGVFDRILAAEGEVSPNAEPQVSRGNQSLARRTPTVPNSAAPARSVPDMAVPEAAKRVGKPEASREMAEQFKVDPQTGAFAEQADVDQLIASGRVAEEDIAAFKDADADLKTANAYGEAVRAFAGCSI